MLLDPRFRAGDDVDELFNWLLWGCTPGFRVSPLRGSATTAQLAVARANGAEFDD